MRRTNCARQQVAQLIAFGLRLRQARQHRVLLLGRRRQLQQQDNQNLDSVVQKGSRSVRLASQQAEDLLADRPSELRKMSTCIAESVFIQPSWSDMFC